MIHELEIKEEADEEITDAYLYYENRQIGLGEKFMEQLEKYFDRIRQNPKHFQIRRKNYREAYIQKFPFSIIYEQEESKIIVYSIFLCYKNPDKKPK